MTEQEQIKEAFDDLLKSLRKDTSKESRQKIKEAFEFANEAHKGGETEIRRALYYASSGSSKNSHKRNWVRDNFRYICVVA